MIYHLSFLNCILLSELQATMFLQSCYYSNELAKYTIDYYFTVKTLCPEIFGNRNPRDPLIQQAINCVLITPLPKLTPQDELVIFIKMMDFNPDNYNFATQIKCFDMITLLHLHKNGPPKGVLIIMDMKGVVFGHFLKIGVVVMKKFLYYLQEGMPIRLKSLQFFNIVPFMDKLLALMKPFMKKELFDSMVLHTDLDSVYKYIPRDNLPQEYGGSCESLQILQEIYKAQINDNADFFKFQDSQVVNESKRPGKPKSVSDVFGVEGTFKKLEVD
nr:alpha-tocopherol transfer protein-like [Leptinotarsa decemlineata]